MTARRPSIAVSDHAVLRWLGRAEGLDIGALRARIAAAAAVGIRYGAAVVVVADVKIVTEDEVVVTVLDRHMVRRQTDLAELEVEGEIVLQRRPRRRRRR